MRQRSLPRNPARLGRGAPLHANLIAQDADGAYSTYSMPLSGTNLSSDDDAFGTYSMPLSEDAASAGASLRADGFWRRVEADLEVQRSHGRWGARVTLDGQL